jgi:hypothetical protein
MQELYRLTAAASNTELFANSLEILMTCGTPCSRGIGDVGDEVAGRSTGQALRPDANPGAGLVDTLRADEVRRAFGLAR